MFDIIDDFQLKNYTEKKGNIFFVRKFNWDYDEAHRFQNRVVPFILENPEVVVLIETSHPHCLTIGRGKESKGFVLPNDLNIKLHKIHRGGGVTFHYPGQWICYPLMKLSYHKINLKDYIYSFLDMVSSFVVKNFNVDVKRRDNPLGIWMDQRKIASMGVGLKKFVTLHGLAVNVDFDQKMFKVISQINPCGIDSRLYSSLDQFNPKIKGDEFKTLINASLDQWSHQFK